MATRTERSNASQEGRGVRTMFARDHGTPEEAARMAQAAGARLLVLTHFFPPADPDAVKRVAAADSTGPMVVGNDGRRIARG